MEEEWKEVSGYSNYLISNKGRLKNIKTGNFLYGSPNSEEYICVRMTNDNKERKTNKIHRLLGEAFIRNTFNKKEINHKDGNKTNNNVENLEWVTKSENIQHSYNILCRKKGMLGRKHTTEAIEKCRRNKSTKRVINVDTGEIFYSLSEAGRKCGILRQNIGKCCRG